MVIEENGIQFNIINGKATVIGLAKDHKGSTLNIPEVVSDNYPVIAIGEHAFQKISKITTVYLPISVQKIKSGAFFSCVGLKEVHMGMSKTPSKTHCEIMRYAFAFCGSLELIDIPAVLFFDVQACINCYHLRYITGVIMNMKASAFSGCEKLDTVFFANDAEVEKDSATYAIINHAIFLGDASITVDTLEGFYENNTTIHCLETSNIVDAAHYGVRVEFV